MGNEYPYQLSTQEDFLSALQTIVEVLVAENGGTLTISKERYDAAQLNFTDGAFNLHRDLDAVTVSFAPARFEMQPGVIYHQNIEEESVTENDQSV